MTPEALPRCYGELDIVFPEGEDGLRVSPESCIACGHKTECLRTAMKGRNGVQVKAAALDRAYAAGMVGFLERWSKKKEFHQTIRDMKKKDRPISRG